MTRNGQLQRRARETHTKHRLPKYKFLVFAVTFGLLGLAFVRLVSAAPSVILFEAENVTTSSQCTHVVNHSGASGGKAVEFGCSQQSGFVHPGVVYSPAEVDSWSTSSPEYARLAATCAGSLNSSSQNCIARSTPFVYGEVINIGSEMEEGLKDQSGFAKVQAVLWAADNNSARRTKVISYLQEFRSVTAYDLDNERYRLVSGWACTNLAQAAEIINYQDAQFRRFLKDVCYPSLDWTQGPNWHASFADSRLAIAAYLGDAALWADAKAYFYDRIKQSFYHSAYDGNKVNPVYSLSSKGVPHLGLTRQHWGGYWGVSQIHDDYTINTSVAPAVDGMNAERMRDLGHVSMSFGAWINGARTILAQGEQLEQHAYDRMLKGIEYHAPRVLAYIQTGVVPHPVPYGIDGETGPGQRFQAWYPARKFFGSDTPAAVHSLLQLPEVRNFAPGGTLHMVGEAFTDNQ